MVESAGSAPKELRNHYRECSPDSLCRAEDCKGIPLHWERWMQEVQFDWWEVV